MKLNPWRECVQLASDLEIAELFEVLAAELGIRGYARLSLLMTQDARLLRQRARANAHQQESRSVTDELPSAPRTGVEGRGW